MGDPLAIVIADAAARAVEFVGFPEAAINLAQATVHLALAPKSNASYMGLNRALDDVRNKAVGEVPKHLRDASYRASARLGHGKGYRVPARRAAGWVDQQYLPDALADAEYYRPTPHGAEGRLAARWRELRGETIPDERRRRRREWVVMSALDLLVVIVAVATLAAAATLCALGHDFSGRRSASRPPPRRSRTRPSRRSPSSGPRRGPQSGEVERIDDLLDVATAIGDRVDSATEVTYKALTSPVIKGVAFASGTRRAAQRLRRRRIRRDATFTRSPGSTEWGPWRPRTDRQNSGGPAGETPRSGSGVGAAAGASGTVWVQQKVKRQLETPRTGFGRARRRQRRRGNGGSARVPPAGRRRVEGRSTMRRARGRAPRRPATSERPAPPPAGRPDRGESLSSIRSGPSVV